MHQESAEAWCGASQKLSSDLLTKTDGDSAPPDQVVDAEASADFADMLLDCIEVFDAAGECN